MKKIYLLLITIMLLSCFGCSTSSANSSNNITADAKDTNNDTTVIYAEQLTYEDQRGDVDGEKSVIFSYSISDAFSLPEYLNEKPLIPNDKRKEVVLQAGISEYDQSIFDIYNSDDENDIKYSMGSVLTINPNSPITGLSKGDTITYEIVIKEGVNITLEQVEEILGVKFEPSEYIVK